MKECAWEQSVLDAQSFDHWIARMRRVKKLSKSVRSCDRPVSTITGTPRSTPFASSCSMKKMLGFSIQCASRNIRRRTNVPSAFGRLTNDSSSTALLCQSTDAKSPLDFSASTPSSTVVSACVRKSIWLM